MIFFKSGMTHDDRVGVPVRVQPSKHIRLAGLPGNRERWKRYMGLVSLSQQQQEKTGGTHVFNITPLQGLDILPHRRRERMVGATPSSVRQKLLFRVVAGKQRELGNPQKVRRFRYFEFALSLSRVKGKKWPCWLMRVSRGFDGGER